MNDILISAIKSADIPIDRKKELISYVDAIPYKILYLSLSGSRIYNTFTDNSDYDFRGIYIQNTDTILKEVFSNTNSHLYYREQLSFDNNDVVFYEVGRFIELIEKQNPNILELLFNDRGIFYADPIFLEYIRSERENLLSKKVLNTFIGYAKTQLKKSTHLNSYIRNPFPKEKKSIFDFMYVIKGNKSIPFYKYTGFDKSDVLEYTENWACVKIPNGIQLYAMYGLTDFKGKGVIKDFNSSNIRLTSIPKHIENKYTPIIVYYNLNGYRKYLKEYNSYWKWVENRNKNRYLLNVNSGAKFDVKNMGHVIRLIDTVYDLFKYNEFRVWRDDTKFIREIFAGKVTLDEVENYVDNKINEIEKMEGISNLPDEINREFTRNILLKIRKNEG